MIVEGYCLEETIDCAVMTAASLLIALDILRLLIQIILTSKTKNLKEIQKGKIIEFQFNIKILFIIATLGISVTQILVWILIEKAIQSALLLQVFSINTLACCLWICALIQDKNRKGRTRLRTMANMSINLISNALIALLTSRNTLDSKDDFSFYLYMGYVGFIGVMQIFFYQRARDYEAISIDELYENSSNEDKLSIRNKSTGPFETDSMKEPLIDKLKQEENGKKSFKMNDSKDQNETHNSAAVLPQKDQLIQEKDDTQQIQENLKLIDLQSESPVGIKEYFEDVRIDKFVEMIKYSKKTIVFQSKFTYQGQTRSVKHSFREFIQLRNQIKSSHPNLELPAFPAKKDQNSILTFADLEERRSLLSAYLQAICKEVEASYLTQFFLPTCYKELKAPGSPKKRSNFKKPFIEDSRNSGSQVAPIPATIWEDDEELTISASK